MGEVAGLEVGDFDLAAGGLRFYRPKVDKIETHKLTADTLAAARVDLIRWTVRAAQMRPVAGVDIATPREAARLQDAGITARALTARWRHRAAVGLVG